MSATIYRCGGCGHKDGDHLGSIGWGGGGDGARPRLGFCSMGGCACNLTPAQVKAMNPDAITVRTFTEADRGTGRWWK